MSRCYSNVSQQFFKLDRLSDKKYTVIINCIIIYWHMLCFSNYNINVNEKLGSVHNKLHKSNGKDEPDKFEVLGNLSFLFSSFFLRKF